MEYYNLTDLGQTITIHEYMFIYSCIGQLLSDK